MGMKKVVKKKVAKPVEPEYEYVEEEVQEEGSEEVEVGGEQPTQPLPPMPKPPVQKPTKITREEILDMAEGHFNRAMEFLRYARTVKD